MSTVPWDSIPAALDAFHAAHTRQVVEQINCDPGGHDTWALLSKGGLELCFDRLPGQVELAAFTERLTMRLSRKKVGSVDHEVQFVVDCDRATNTMRVTANRRLDIQTPLTA